MDAFARLQRMERMVDGLNQLVFRPHVLKLVLQDATEDQLDTIESIVIAALGRPE